jgi:hypothetical protein
MIRMLAKAFFTVLVIQWLHNEAMMVAPGLRPMSDGLRSIVRIPTHDRWQAISEAMAQHRDQFMSKQLPVPSQIRVSRLAHSFTGTNEN